MRLRSSLSLSHTQTHTGQRSQSRVHSRRNQTNLFYWNPWRQCSLSVSGTKREKNTCWESRTQTCRNVTFTANFLPLLIHTQSVSTRQMEHVMLKCWKWTCTIPQSWEHCLQKVTQHEILGRGLDISKVTKQRLRHTKICCGSVTTETGNTTKLFVQPKKEPSQGLHHYFNKLQGKLTWFGGQIKPACKVKC